MTKNITIIKVLIFLKINYFNMFKSNLINLIHIRTDMNKKKCIIYLMVLKKFKD